MQPVIDNGEDTMRFISFRLMAVAVALFVGVAAKAATLSYHAVLDGATENPSVVTPGTGTARVTIDTLANTMRLQVSFSDLIGTVTMAHIHGPATFPNTAGVMTTTPYFLGFPLGVTSGTYDSTFDLGAASTFNNTFINNNGGTVAGAAAAFLAALAAEQAYLNIHTTYSAPGEIRGFFAPVPVPPALGLMLAALAGLGLAARRRAG